MKRIHGNNLILLLFFASAVVVLVVALASGRMMTQSADMIAETSKKEMVALSRAAALLATADELDEFMTAADMEKPAYKGLQKELGAFTQKSGIAFTYYLRLDPETNRMQFIIDNTGAVPSGLMMEQVDREPTPDIALSGEAAAVELGSYSEGWEGYLTAFAPVYYSDGRLSNIVAGVDMLDIYIRQANNNMNTLSVILMSSLALVLGICLLCLLLYRRKARQSEAASISKSSFLSNMSHEMRTPMNAIIGMAEIAKASEDPQRIRYCLGKIDDAAGHLLGVINDVLDISKIEASKFALSPAEFLFKKMLERVVGVISFKVDEKRQIFTVKVDEDVPEAMVTDNQRLAQVITNLLANAVKFTPEEGRIDLHIHLLGQEDDICTLQVDVSDSGIGIAPDQMENLFNAFEQADGNISRRFGGTGLGLAISKNIVDLMGGALWVESEPGKGSTFSFTFTARVAELRMETEDAAASGEGIEGIFAGKRVLLAEDVEVNREIVVSLLESTGISIECAVDGQDACRKFAEDPEGYQLILMDIHMPGMDGYQAAGAIRTMTVPGAKEIPIVAMTANVFREDVERCLASGMNDHIGKPVDFAEIIEKLKKHL